MIRLITEPFCGDCNQLCLTADGQAFTCLFGSESTDIKLVINNAVDLRQRIIDLLMHLDGSRCSLTEERHYNSRGSTHAEMAYLGG